MAQAGMMPSGNAEKCTELGKLKLLSHGGPIKKIIIGVILIHTVRINSTQTETMLTFGSGVKLILQE
jgi:hypothetical protein